MSKKRKSASTKPSKSARARKTTRRRAPSPRRALSAATNSRKGVNERVRAMPDASRALCHDDKGFQAMLKVLRDRDEPIQVRLAALASLQAASFSVVAFESCRSDYTAALREVVDDPNPELRQRVLGLLAREKDGYAQKRLLEGLENPAKALLPPEKALQLLGYDVHADAYRLARKIVDKPPSEIAKREALRLLAADTSAKPVFEKILSDKNEAPEYRQISAAALHAIAPDSLQRRARSILLDSSESDEIQATSLTAITQFGDDKAVAEDNELMKRVDRLSAGTPSAKVKQSAKRFLSKYGQ
ncbi:MAG: hypothetical protein ABW318_09720 [Vicinamibacterales bacterium]